MIEDEGRSARINTKARRLFLFLGRQHEIKERRNANGRLKFKTNRVDAQKKVETEM